MVAAAIAAFPEAELIDDEKHQRVAGIGNKWRN
jgi:hypothetical protein